MPNKPKKLVKELTKIENKLKSSSKPAIDLRKHGQDELPGEARTPKYTLQKSKAGRPGTAVPILKNTAKPPTDTGMLYSLCDKYTKGVKSHTTILCKR
jgi:hypothetical protein